MHQTYGFRPQRTDLLPERSHKTELYKESKHNDKRNFHNSLCTLENTIRKISGIIALTTGIFSGPTDSFAIDKGWTDRNRLAAETWRTVDENFLDRTFNGQDWLKLRMNVVKRA